jgi:hypothetical protein
LLYMQFQQVATFGLQGIADECLQFSRRRATG